MTLELSHNIGELLTNSGNLIKMNSHDMYVTPIRKLISKISISTKKDIHISQNVLCNSSLKHPLCSNNNYNERLNVA